MENYDDSYYSKFISSSRDMDEDERFVTSSKIEADDQIENILRPKTFDEYVGQTGVKENLRVYISAAKKRNEALDHVLCMDLQVLEKPLLLRLLQMKWVQPSSLLQALQLKSLATLHRCLQT